MANLFFSCKSLTGEIPENLFKNCTKVTSFSAAFYNCKGLIGAAPELWKRENVTSSVECFDGCTGLSNYADIPAGWK